MYTEQIMLHTCMVLAICHPDINTTSTQETFIFQTSTNNNMK
jgi:hypothetical protein